MRIDPNPVAAGSGGPERVDAPAGQAARLEPTGGGPVDRVEVSDGAKHVQRMVAEAVKAAGTPTEVRADVVDRARALLGSGELGRDSIALASAIIDDLLYRP